MTEKGAYYFIQFLRDNLGDDIEFKKAYRTWNFMDASNALGEIKRVWGNRWMDGEGRFDWVAEKYGMWEIENAYWTTESYCLSWLIAIIGGSLTLLYLWKKLT